MKSLNNPNNTFYSNLEMCKLSPDGINKMIQELKEKLKPGTCIKVEPDGIYIFGNKFNSAP